MPRHPLPDPATCTWWEAEQIAEVLEGLADEMRARIGPPPATGLRHLVTRSRRQGKQSMMILTDGRALSYRLRQAQLRMDD